VLAALACAAKIAGRLGDQLEGGAERPLLGGNFAVGVVSTVVDGGARIAWRSMSCDSSSWVWCRSPSHSTAKARITAHGHKVDPVVTHLPLRDYPISGRDKQGEYVTFEKETRPWPNQGPGLVRLPVDQPSGRSIADEGRPASSRLRGLASRRPTSGRAPRLAATL